MPENGSSNKFGYSGPTHDYECRLIREDLEEHEEIKLGRLIDEICKNVVFPRFEEAHEKARGDVYTTFPMVMNR